MSKHQTTGKWLDRNHTIFEFMEKQVLQCSVSVRERRQKRGSEYLHSMKTGRIVAHENLHIFDVAIGKQIVHCLLLKFEKLLGIL